MKFGTDKVTTHQYWFMYDKHFPAIRERRVKMLEIGLGCDMSYGPGKSYYTWLEYFPDVELYVRIYEVSSVFCRFPRRTGPPGALLGVPSHRTWRAGRGEEGGPSC